MKRIFAFMLGIGLIFLTSCQQKDLEKKVYTDNGNVSLTVYASDALQTRASLELNSNLGGISNVDRDAYYLRYQLAVYLDGEEVLEPQVQMASAFGGATYSLSLADGNTYTVVVWADFVKDSSGATDLHYDTSDLTDITCLDASDAQLNDESRDAYFAYQDVTVEDGSASASITLRRPFAKVRMIATDWQESGVGMPDAIDISYYDCTRFTSLNALTGEATGETLTSAQTYSATINTSSKAYDGGYDAIDGYRTLTVDYLLAESEVSAIHLSYVTYDNGSQTHAYDIEEDIPIERNYITTIIGDLLTTNENITISIDEGFEGEYTYELGKFTSDAVDTYEYDGTYYPVVYIGTPVTLTPSITADGSWTWTSSDESIATVDDGVVTGVAEGLVTVTAKCSTATSIQVCSGKFYVMAAEAVPGGISLDATSVNLPIDKGTYTIEYNEPEGCSQSVTFALTANEDNAIELSTDGVITVKGFGSATVTLTSSAEEIDDDYSQSVELTVTVPYGYYDEAFSSETSNWALNPSQSSSWVWSQNSDTGEGYYTVTTTAGRADFGHYTTGSSSSFGSNGDYDVYLDPTYPIVCFRFDDLHDSGYTCNINVDTSGHLVSDDSDTGKYSGELGKNNNGWASKYTCSDGSAILVYDLSSQTFTNNTDAPLPSTAHFTTFQIKYADIKDSDSATPSSVSYRYFWFKTFASETDMTSYLSEWSAETGITYSAN